MLENIPGSVHRTLPVVKKAKVPYMLHRSLHFEKELSNVNPNMKLLLFLKNLFFLCCRYLQSKFMLELIFPDT